MNLFSELDAFERDPEYLNAPPEDRVKALDAWKGQASRLLAKSPDEISAAEDVVEETLGQRKSRERARLRPTADGVLPPLVPGWNDMASSPEFFSLDPDKKKQAASLWADTAAEQRNGVRLNKSDRELWLIERKLAEADAASDMPVPRDSVNPVDLIRPAQQVAAQRAKEPVAKTGRASVVMGDDGIARVDVHPTAALQSEDEYAAMIDSLDAPASAKMDAKAAYDINRNAAKDAIEAKLVPTTEQESPGFAKWLMGPVVQAYNLGKDMLPDTVTRKVDRAAAAVTGGFKTSGPSYAVTPSMIEDYKEDGASAIPLLSDDPVVRAAAEKQVLSELAADVLPGIDADLAAAAQNPESSQARELLNVVRDKMQSQLWVDAEDAADYPSEQVRVLSDGTPVWNPKVAEGLSKAEITATVDKLGLTGDTREEAIAAGIQARNAAVVDDLSTIRQMGRPYQEGFTQGVTLDLLSSQDTEYRNFVLNKLESEDFRSGKIDEADIAAEWKKQNTGPGAVASAVINRALGAIPELGKQLSIMAVGGAAAGAGLLGIRTPEFDRWVDENVQINGALQQAAAGAETTRAQRLFGQFGKEIPFLGVGALAARVARGGARAATAAADVATSEALKATATAAGTAVEKRMVLRAAMLKEKAVASTKALQDGTSTAVRTYFGAQTSRSAGDMYTSVYGQLKSQGLAAGMTEEQARENARTGAVIPAIVAGAVTGTLMKLMPGGSEKLIRTLGQTPTLGAVATAFGSKRLTEALSSKPWKAAFAGALTSVFSGAAREGVEEAIDEFTQTVIRAGYDESIRLDDMLSAAGEAGLVGGLMGGAAGGIEGTLEQRGNMQRQRDTELAERRRVRREVEAKKARMSGVLDELDRTGSPEVRKAYEDTFANDAEVRTAMETDAFNAVELGLVASEAEDADPVVMYESKGSYRSEAEATARVAEVTAFMDRVKGKREDHPVVGFDVFARRDPQDGTWRVVALKDPAAMQAAPTTDATPVEPVKPPEVDTEAHPAVQELLASIAAASQPKVKETFEGTLEQYKALSAEYTKTPADARRPELSDELEQATASLNKFLKKKPNVKLAVNPEFFDAAQATPATLLPEGEAPVRGPISRKRGKRAVDQRSPVQQLNDLYSGVEAKTVAAVKAKAKLHRRLTKFAADPASVEARDKALDHVEKSAFGKSQTAALRQKIAQLHDTAVAKAAAQTTEQRTEAAEAKAPTTKSGRKSKKGAAAPAATDAPAAAPVEPATEAPVVEPVVAEEAAPEAPAETAPVVEEAPADTSPVVEAAPAEPTPPPTNVDYNEVKRRHDEGDPELKKVLLPDWVEEGFTQKGLGEAIDALFGVQKSKKEKESRPHGVFVGAISLASQKGKQTTYNAMTPAMKDAFADVHRDRVLKDLEADAEAAFAGGTNTVNAAREGRAFVDAELDSNPEALAVLAKMFAETEAARLKELAKDARKAAVDAAKNAAALKKSAVAAAAKAKAAGGKNEAANAAKTAAANKASEARRDAAAAEKAADKAENSAEKAKVPRKNPTSTSLSKYFAQDIVQLYARLESPAGTEDYTIAPLREVAGNDLHVWSLLRRLHDSKVAGMKQVAETLLEGYMAPFSGRKVRKPAKGKTAADIFGGRVDGVRVFSKTTEQAAVEILVNGAVRIARPRAARRAGSENTVSLDAQLGDVVMSEAVDSGAGQLQEDAPETGVQIAAADGGYQGPAESAYISLKGAVTDIESATAYFAALDQIAPEIAQDIRPSILPIAEAAAAERQKFGNRRAEALMGKELAKVLAIIQPKMSTDVDVMKTISATMMLVRAELDRLAPPVQASRAQDRAVIAEDRAPRTEQQKKTAARLSKELASLGAVDGDPLSLALALSKIADSGEFPSHLAASARLLIDTGAINRVESFRIVNDPDLDAAGFYDPNTGEVLINLANPNPRGAADVIVHELFHPVWSAAFRETYPVGSPAAAAAERFRLVYEDAKFTYRQRRAQIDSLTKDLEELVVMRVMLESPGAMRRAVARAKAKGMEYAADYTAETPLSEVRGMYAAHIGESSGSTAALNLVEDFDYVFDAPETAGVSNEFVTHLATDHNFQVLIDRVLSGSGTAEDGKPLAWRPMLRALWTNGLALFNESAAKAAPAQLPSMPLLFDDLRMLIGDSSTSYTPSRVRNSKLRVSVATAPATSSTGEAPIINTVSVQPFVTAASGIDRDAAADAIDAVEPLAESRVEVEVDPEIAAEPGEVAAVAYSEGTVVRLAVSPDLAVRMNSRSMTPLDLQVLRDAVAESQALAAEVFYEGPGADGYRPAGVMMSRAKNPSFASAPDWLKRYIDSATIGGMSPDEADAWAEFGVPEFLADPRGWTVSSTTDDIAKMAWIVNRKIREATAAGGWKARIELPALLDQAKVLSGISDFNPAGDDHQRIYGMRTSFDAADHKPLKALKRVGINRMSRVAGKDAVYTPAALRVDASYTAITSAMDTAYRALPVGTADKTLWFAAVMDDAKFAASFSKLNTPGLFGAISDFREAVREKYPVMSTADAGALTGMPEFMQTAEVVARAMASISVTRDRGKLAAQLDIVINRLGMKDGAETKDAVLDGVFASGASSRDQEATIVLFQEKVDEALGEYADEAAAALEMLPKGTKPKGLKFLAAGSEAFSFVDRTQGIVYKFMMPRFTGREVGFGIDLTAPEMGKRGPKIMDPAAHTLGRSPLRQMLLEEHTAVPGLVDSEVVAITSFGAIVVVQKEVPGGMFTPEAHGAQALLWTQEHNATFFDGRALSPKQFPEYVSKDSVLIRDATGGFRVLMDFRRANVFAKGPVLYPFDVLVSSPVSDEVMETPLLARAAAELMKSRKATKLMDRLKGWRLATSKGSFAEEFPTEDPNEILEIDRFVGAGLSRYGKFGKKFYQTKQDFDFRMAAVRRASVNMLKELDAKLKGATPDQYKWVNLLLGSQDNMYDDAMHAAAVTAYRRAKLSATRKYRSARRRAAAFQGMPEEQTMLAEAATAFDTAMRTATTDHNAALDAALASGITAFKLKQDAARNDLQASAGGDVLYRSAMALRQEIDRLSSEMLKHSDVDPRVRAIIARNDGVYLTRAYQMHDDPNYAAMVRSSDPQMEQRMTAALDEFRNRTRQGYISRLLATLPPVAASLTAARAAADRWMVTSGESIAKLALNDFLNTHQEISRGGGAAGTLNRGILIEKTDLEPPLRNLLGQTSDNVAAAARTLHELGRYNATHEFQENLFESLTEAETARAAEASRLKALGTTATAEETAELRRLESLVYFTNSKEIALRHKLQPFARAGERLQADAYGPLQEMYGPSLLVEAVHSLDPEEVSGMVSSLQWLTARSQMNLTVLSPKSQIRNALANPGWFAAAGHYQVWKMLWKRRVSDVLSAAGSDKAAAKDRLKEFYALYGVTGGSALSAVMDTIADTGYANTEETLERLYQSAAARAATKAGVTAGKVIGATEEWAKSIYEASDDFFKVAIFEAELAEYMESFGVSPQPDGSIAVSDTAVADRIISAFGKNNRIPAVKMRELAGNRQALARELLIREAAASTRDSIAYYDHLPPLITGLKRNLGILAAPFLSYRVAMPMAVLGSLKRAYADTQNPETRTKGLKRFAGIALLFTAFNTVAAGAVKLGVSLIGALFGTSFDDEDRKKLDLSGVTATDSDRDKALRDLLGDWYRNRAVSYLGIGPDGDALYSDISWLNPTSSLRDVFIPLMANLGRTTRSGADFSAAARESLSRLVEPFISPQVTVHELFAAVTSEKYDAQTRTVLEKAVMGAAAVMKAALVPGVANDALKVGRAMGTSKQAEELTSFMTGMRIKSVNVSEAVGFRLSSVKKKLDAAAGDLRKLRYKEKPTDAEVTEEYGRVMDRYKRAMQEARDTVESARLFTSYDTIKSVLRDGEHGISRRNILGIERGVVPAYQLPDTVVVEMKKADQKHGTSRAEAYRKAEAAQAPLSLY